MKRHHPSPYMTVDVSQEVYGALLSASADTVFEKEDWEIAAIAIQEWIARNDPGSLGKPARGGYQWKDVFLPAGALLRTVCGRKNYHCHIEGDNLIYEGKQTSPNGFVNAAGGMRRSAWKHIWVLFPGSTVWTLAEELRTRPRHRPRKKR